MAYYHQAQPPPYSEILGESHTQSQEQHEEDRFIQHRTEWIHQNPRTHIMPSTTRLEVGAQ